jgi:hypothetical protein
MAQNANPCAHLLLVPTPATVVKHKKMRLNVGSVYEGQAMQFKIDGETLRTGDLVTLEIDGIYLTVYLDPPHRRAFLQTFDDERGILIEPLDPPRATALLSVYEQSHASDIASCRRRISEIVQPLQRADANRSHTRRNPC